MSINLKTALAIAIDRIKLKKDIFEQEDWYSTCSFMRHVAKSLPISLDQQRYATRLSDAISAYFAGTHTHIDIPNIIYPYIRNSIENVLMETICKHTIVTASLDGDCSIFVNYNVATKIHRDWHSIPLHNNQSFAGLLIHLCLCCSEKPKQCKCNASTQTEETTADSDYAMDISFISPRSRKPSLRNISVQCNVTPIAPTKQTTNPKGVFSDACIQCDSITIPIERDIVYSEDYEYTEETDLQLGRLLVNMYTLLGELNNTRYFQASANNSNISEAFSLTAVAITQFYNILRDINQSLITAGLRIYMFDNIDRLAYQIDTLQSFLDPTRRMLLDNHTIAEHIDSIIDYIRLLLMNNSMRIQLIELYGIILRKLRKYSNTDLVNQLQTIKTLLQNATKKGKSKTIEKVPNTPMKRKAPRTNSPHTSSERNSVVANESTDLRKQLSDCRQQLREIRDQLDQCYYDREKELIEFNKKHKTCNDQLKDCLFQLEQRNVDIETLNITINKLDDSLARSEKLVTENKQLYTSEMESELHQLKERITDKEAELQNCLDKLESSKSQAERNQNKRDIDQLQLDNFESDIRSVIEVDGTLPPELNPFNLAEIKVLTSLNTNIFERIIEQDENQQYITLGIEALQKVVEYCKIDVRLLPDNLKYNETFMNLFPEMKFINTDYDTEDSQVRENTYSQILNVASRLKAELQLKIKEPVKRRKNE